VRGVTTTPTAARRGGATKQCDANRWNADRFDVILARTKLRPARVPVCVQSMRASCRPSATSRRSTLDGTAQSVLTSAALLANEPGLLQHGLYLRVAERDLVIATYRLVKVAGIHHRVLLAIELHDATNLTQARGLQRRSPPASVQKCRRSALVISRTPASQATRRPPQNRGRLDPRYLSRYKQRSIHYLPTLARSPA
jgi:hypothetical protein